MVKALLWIIGTIVGLIALVILGLMIWFFTVYSKVPELIISEDASSLEAVEKINIYLSDLNENNKFNGFVMIAEEGRPLLVETYGYTDHTLTKPLTNDSSLRLASVSKQFTAAGILVLQEQGKIDIDDLITKHIPQFPYQDVTIRHLLNHTSGIPDAYMRLAQAHRDSFKFLTLDKAIELLQEAKLPPNGRPNDAYAYSNTNYVLLAYLIEQVTGESFETFMARELFQPMGLANTRIWNLSSGTASFSNKANDMGIFVSVADPIEPSFLDGVAGDGAVFSSANDFLIWDSFWYGNPLVSDANLKEAFQKPVLNNGKGSSYGFGWVIRDYGSFHNGSWLGARSIYLRNTHNKIAFVLVDNSSNINFDNISNQIAMYYTRQN